MPTSSNNVDVFANTVSGGGSGTPASTVVSETAFGQASAVGTSTAYARADHTHGTPPTPAVFDPLVRSGWIEAGPGTIGITGMNAGLSNTQYAAGSGATGYTSNKFFDAVNYVGGQFFIGPDGLPLITARILTQQTATAAQTYFGFNGGLPMSIGSPTAALVFDRSQFPGQTNWYLVTDDGTGTVTVNTGVPYANGTVYKMEVSFPTTTSVTAKINGTTVATSPTFSYSGDLVFGLSDTNSVGYNRLWIQEGS